MTSSNPAVLRESAVPLQMSAIETALAVGLAVLIAFGAVAASTSSRNTEAHLVETMLTDSATSFRSAPDRLPVAVRGHARFFHTM